MTDGQVKFSGGDVDMSAAVARWLPSEKQLYLATKTATSRTLRWARALAVKSIREETRLPAALLRRRITTYIQSKGTNRARLFFGLHPLPAAWLDPRQDKTGVKVKGGRTFPHAFLVRGQVYKRTGKERYPIQYQRIFFHEAAERVIRGEIMPQWARVYLENLERELKWRTTRQ